uniref:Ig-like domain-containing protein n=1 Tax=Trichuris muris TaxID=70415 RepID=A0A5S6QKG5_TRIMR
MYVQKLCCSLMPQLASVALLIGIARCENLRYHERPSSRPYFDPTMRPEVTALATEPAYLHCIVHNLGSAETAWIRQSDRQIISVQDVTVTSDYRFQISHRKYSDDWCLIIKHTTANDTGAYECLLSTDPPLRFVTHLYVVENNVSISGSSVVEEGGTIIVRCAVTLMVASGSLPSSVLWYANGTLIPYTKNIKYHHYVTVSKMSLISELRVRAATFIDSGVYSCKCDNAPVRELHISVKGNASTLPTRRTASYKSSGLSCKWEPLVSVISLFWLILWK